MDVITPVDVKTPDDVMTLTDDDVAAFLRSDVVAEDDVIDGEAAGVEKSSDVFAVDVASPRAPPWGAHP